MRDRYDDDAPDPLPRDWLPDATARDGAAAWEAKVGQIVAAADPALRRLANSDREIDAPWSTMLGAYWKPAAVLAAAAAALLFILDPVESREESDPAWLPLSVVAAKGEPYAVWQGLGIDADPVLALIAMQETPR